MGGGLRYCMAEAGRAHPLSTLSAILSLSFKDQVIAVAAAARDLSLLAGRIGERILLREDTKIRRTCHHTHIHTHTYAPLGCFRIYAPRDHQVLSEIQEEDWIDEIWDRDKFPSEAVAIGRFSAV